MNVIETVPPTLLPFTLTEIGEQLYLEPDEVVDRQEYFIRLAKVAVDYAQTKLDSSLMPRTLAATYYEGDKLWLRYGPLISITHILDDDGDSITDYEVEKFGNVEILKLNEAVTYPITVTYQAGYASAAAIPPKIVHAMLAHINDMHKYRGLVSEKSLTPVPHLDNFYRLHKRSMGLG